MVDAPIPRSFRNIGQQIEGNKVHTMFSHNAQIGQN